MVITDELAQEIAANVVHIRGVFYHAVLEDQQFSVGDVVLDRLDGLHGTIDMIIGDSCAIRDGYVTELGVPLSRLIKLIRNTGQ